MRTIGPERGRVGVDAPSEEVPVCSLAAITNARTIRATAVRRIPAGARSRIRATQHRLEPLAGPPVAVAVDLTPDRMGRFAVYRADGCRRPPHGGRRQLTDWL
jgi:hypothetical protein